MKGFGEKRNPTLHSKSRFYPFESPPASSVSASTCPGLKDKQTWPMKQDAHASAVGSSPSDPFVLSGGRNLPRGGNLDYLQKARRGIRDPERTCDEVEHRVDLLVDAHEYRRSGTRLLPREQSLYLLLIPGYLRDARDVYLGDLRRGLDIYAEPHRELPGASVALVQRGGHLEGTSELSFASSESRAASTLLIRTSTSTIC